MEAVKILDGKYEILEEIKRGGFGVISFGRDLLFDKPIAVKAISPNFIGEAEYVDLFQAEALAIARLNHHNIIRIYDIKRDASGQFYIIMEYVDGVDLRQFLKAHRREDSGLPPHLCAALIAEVCAGLDYAHTRRDPDTHQPLHLVHQDISPGNIMINRLGEVKIIDFGLAGARRRSQGLERGKNEILVQGKVGYLAPEQIEHVRLDHRVDIFALGIVLYELLTGKRLFADQKMEIALEKLRSGHWDLSTLPHAGVSDLLIQIVARALQKEPAHRFQSANHMYLELMNYLAEQAPAMEYALELGTLVQKIAPERVFRTTPPLPSTPAFVAADFAPGSGSAAIAPTAEEIKLPGEPQALETELILELNEENTNLFSSGSDNGADEKNEPPVEVEVTPQADNDFTPFSGPAAPPQGAFYRVIDEEEEEGEVRTIIDVVRLSARAHRQTILRASGGVLGALLLFVITDIFTRWTTLGAGIYDYLFPPAIRIVSFPPNAQVYLDDKPLPKTTPLAIDDISPGVHKLTLTLPRFEPIVRSIQVMRKGQVAVVGESKREGDHPYVFRFKMTLEITSQPPGAEVYLNGIPYAQPTPCHAVIEVGDPLKIALRKPGLMALEGFTLNTLEGAEIIEDHRLWKFERIEGQREHFAVTGFFAKQIKINSTPSLAEIFIDGGENSVGVTGYATELLLPMGAHSITLLKAEYLPKTIAITIDEASPAEYNEMLSRVVRIFAKQADDASDNDIGAQVTELVYGERRTRLQVKTPCELTLLPLTYTITLTKEGYGPHTLTIPPGTNMAIARMIPGSVDVEIMVLDGQSEGPLAGAEISCQDTTAGVGEKFFGRTDADGVAANALAPGIYNIRIAKAGFHTATQEYQITTGGQSALVIKLSPQQ
ncbi:MAG: protein kinase domain-containing protein [bacterium]